MNRDGWSSRSISTIAASKTTAPRRAIVTSAERARDLKQRPAYVMASAQGSGFRQGAAAENGPDYASNTQPNQ